MPLPMSHGLCRRPNPSPAQAIQHATPPPSLPCLSAHSTRGNAQATPKPHALTTTYLGIVGGHTKVVVHIQGSSKGTCKHQGRGEKLGEKTSMNPSPHQYTAMCRGRGCHTEEKQLVTPATCGVAMTGQGMWHVVPMTGQGMWHVVPMTRQGVWHVVPMTGKGMWHVVA